MINKSDNFGEQDLYIYLIIIIQKNIVDKEEVKWKNQ